MAPPVEWCGSAVGVAVAVGSEAEVVVVLRCSLVSGAEAVAHLVSVFGGGLPLTVVFLWRGGGGLLPSVEVFFLR